MSEQQKCLIYCRISDLKQREGSGLKSQEHRCRQAANEKSYSIEAVFQDEYTGGGDYARRPGMSALLVYLKTHNNDNYIVLFDDLKRLARDTRFHLQLRQVLSGYGATVECLNYQFEDSPEGDFMETLFAAQGELERKQIGRQTKQKTKARLEAGFHAFIAPVGFRYLSTKTQGKLLVQDENVAPILKEALESFAAGRFQTPQELRYFLENEQNFPKGASGKLGNTKAKDILTNPLYAGYIEYKPWGITLRKGQHQGIISYEVFCKNQERLLGRAHAPTRKNLNKDFILRGSVECECGNALTAAWSKSGTGKQHAYYLCQNRKCEHKGKSIRRDVIEGEFEDVLKALSPSTGLVKIADKMFRNLWSQRAADQKTRKTRLEQESKSLDGQIEKLLDHIVNAESSAVMKRLETRVCDLEDQKRVAEEKFANFDGPVKPFDQMYRTAMLFLKNPNKIWQLGGFEEKRAIIKMAFTDRLIYDRKTGYRTPELSLPFKYLTAFFMQEKIMVPRAGIEPARCCHRKILSLVRLPISPPGQMTN